MTQDEWEARLQMCFAAVDEATRTAQRWVSEGQAGQRPRSREESVQRETDLEDAASSWVALIDWYRQQPRRRPD